MKCSCGSWRRQLVHGGVEIQKPLKMKKVVPLQHFFQKRFSIITFKNEKMEALFAHARDQKLPTQSQINLPVLCVCVLVTCG